MCTTMWAAEGEWNVEPELFAGFADRKKGAHQYSEGLAGDSDAAVQDGGVLFGGVV